MLNKRGMSQVLTTILFILAGLVAISIIWAGINTFSNGSISKITMTPFTLDLKIESAKINVSSYLATIKVARNPGEGQLNTIKFIFEDEENAETYEEPAENFPELAKKTFTIDLSQSFLDIKHITRISIVPTYFEGGNSKPSIGQVADTTEGIIYYDLEGDRLFGEGTSTGLSCETDGDCPEDQWIGAKTCNADGDTVVQDYQDYYCSDGYCVYNTISDKPVEACWESEKICYDGACVEQLTSCTDETECGTDGPVDGTERCQSSPEAVVQDYKDYSCIDGYCESSTTTQVIDDCASQGLICLDEACVVEVECQTNADCLAKYGEGYVCNSTSYCEPETVLYSGSIRSAWPVGISEYFDSYDLPQGEDADPVPTNMYIIFPGSQETRCLQIKEYHDLSNIGSIAYVRLNESKTNITGGDNYEIWETSYGCTQI